MSVHIVIGSGPVGRATVRELAGKGLSVRLVSRNPSSDLGVPTVAASATDPDALADALAGGSVVYHCANAPYHQWTTGLPPIWAGILAATSRVGARLVIATNLYAYGKPTARFTEDSPISPCSQKGRVRAALEAEAMAAHTRGEAEVSLVRASDFYGPEVHESQLGERVFARLLEGKPASMVGVKSARHSYTWLPDVAKTMVEVGTRSDTWGKTWIAPTAPAVTGDELETLVRSVPTAAGATASIRFAGKGFLRFGGIFVPAARELIEMFYEFDRDFEVDSEATENELGIAPMPLDQGIRDTFDWYRSAAASGTNSVVVGK